MTQHVVAVMYDETEEDTGQAQAFDTLDEALEVARGIAGDILSHVEHLHAIPHLEVFEYANPSPVWEWRAPSF